jgi:hypothetical protein
MLDGQIVNSPFNAFNEVLPGFVSQSPAYMNLREMVVTHTGLERDCEVNYAYTLTTKAGLLPGLFGKILVGGNDPIQHLEIIIKVPKDTKLNLYFSNQGPMGEKTVQDNYDVYSWKINNIPLIPIESGQPDLEEYLPVLYFSTISPSELVRTILMSDKDLFKLDSKTISFFKELIKDKFTFQDRAKNIKDYVLNNIGSSNIKCDYIGLKPMKAQSTFDRAVGSYLDNAILLVALCRAVGINSELAITANYPNAKPDISLISQFGNYVVFCTPDNENEQSLLLDPNHRQSTIIPDIIKNKPTFVINTEKIFVIPEIKEIDYLAYNANLKLENNVLTGKAKLQCSGSYFEDADIIEFDKKVNSNLKNQKWVESDKDLIQGIMMNNQFEKNINLSYKTEKMKSELTEINLLNLPNTSLNKNIKVLPVSRITPYKLPMTINEEYGYTIELPEKSKALFSSVNINEENKIGTLNILIQQDGKNLVITKKLKIQNQYILPEDYHLLYKLLSSWFNERYNKIYIE